MPNDFWMNSVGGKTAKKGYWITALMYTENEADAAGFKEVLLRWQAKGNDKNKRQRSRSNSNWKKEIDY